MNCCTILNKVGIHGRLKGFLLENAKTELPFAELEKIMENLVQSPKT